jgi:hypothetical protein
MEWPDLGKVLECADARPPSDYYPERLNPNDVFEVIRLLQDWFPDMVVSSEAYHLDPDFYFSRTMLAGYVEAEHRNTFPLALKCDGKIAFFLSMQRESMSRTITGRMLAVSHEHRGRGLGNLAPRILETMGRAMGAELAYYYATLRTIHQQVAAENAGYRLVGLMPASDRNRLSDSLVKRVYEAIYAKVLIQEGEVLVPPTEVLTPSTRSLWQFLFSQKRNEVQSH